MTSPSEAPAKANKAPAVPAEPQEEYFVLMATRVSDGRVFALNRKDNGLWNNVTQPNGVTEWAQLWSREWTRQRMLGVMPDYDYPSVITYEYGHRPNEEGERTFCASDEWDQSVANSHEAWRLVTTWNTQPPTVHRGAWVRLPFPRD